MSMRAAVPLLLSGALACASSPPEATPPPATSPADAPSSGAAVPLVPVTPAAGSGTREAVAAAGLTPASLYEQCRGRVEGRESPGECDTDADCTATGCSGEVCVTQEAAAGMMTTCEMLKCFEALDTCGCVEGVCSWSLKDSVGVGQPLPVPLPRK